MIWIFPDPLNQGVVLVGKGLVYEWLIFFRSSIIEMEHFMKNPLLHRNIFLEITVTIGRNIDPK